ncbi:MAG: GntR family transcriptional regulator, carbon starvation induced regulator [Actinomycetota bacterium]|nr:GntR family transcriptional regulator, carbon starvation induced regulator [Actinomycetota bacterium]
MQRLSQGVVTGEFAPGQRLKAQDLADAWNLSATPVREALQRLASMGLAEAVPNRGVRVAPIVVEEVREVYSLRLLLEPLCLRISLEARDTPWRDSVDRGFADLEAHLAQETVDLVEFERVHGAFHAALLSRCDSTWMTRIIGMLNAHSVRYRLLSIGPRGGASEVLDEHRRLYEACIGDDVDEAVARLFAHIRRTVEAITDVSESDRVVALIEAAGTRVHTEALGT